VSALNSSEESSTSSFNFPNIEVEAIFDPCFYSRILFYEYLDLLEDPEKTKHISQINSPVQDLPLGTQFKSSSANWDSQSFGALSGYMQSIDCHVYIVSIYIVIDIYIYINNIYIYVIHEYVLVLASSLVVRSSSPRNDIRDGYSNTGNSSLISDHTDILKIPSE
jgi:hypothetical protein